MVRQKRRDGAPGTHAESSMRASASAGFGADDRRRETTMPSKADWLVRAFAAAALLVACAASAWAQDYAVTPSSGQLVTRPSGATALSMSLLGAETVSVPLPFEFPYFGRLYTSVVVSPSGMIVPGATPPISLTTVPGGPHGQSMSTGAFPYTPSGSGGTTSGGYCDGVIAPYWDGFNLGGTPSTGQCFWWIDGTAPTRRCVVSWENASYSSGPGFTVQVHLYEGSGRIVFAYSATPSAFSYNALSYYICGIDGPGDARYVIPLVNGRNNHGYPGGDFVLDPRAVTYAGTLQYDKIVSDASGIGNSTLANRPLAGQRLELRSGGVVVADATTAADGGFSLAGIGVPSTASGTLNLMAQCGACRVLTSAGGATTEWAVNANVSFATGADFGVTDLGVAGDSSGALRSAFNVARDCQAAYEWASPRTGDSIARLDVVVDPSSSAVTGYAPASYSGPAAMTVAGAAGANPDAWDDAVVTKTYARHVLASIAAAPPTSSDYRFDAVSDTQNAFAEAFGWYLWSAVSGASTAVDGKSATSAAVYDLESPKITVAKGPDVAGCMAGALHDLLDPANETIDPVDGGVAQDRVFRIVDTFTDAPKAATFLQAWVDAGYDAAGITRVFVGNGVLADDPLEPNDSLDEAAALGAVGVVRRNLVLNRFNEDWFSATLAADATSLAADATYEQASSGATVAVEIRDAGGTLLATGTLIPTTGAVHAVTGAVTAGTYKIRVRHVSGGAVSTYAFQAYVPPSMPAKPLADWTVGRAYDAALGVGGGIAPFTTQCAMPPGLGLNSTTLHAGGTPTTVGTYQVTLQVTDGGSPANVVARSQTVTIHDVFKIPVGPFVGFPAGKAVDLSLPTRGGTPPFTLTISSGALPAGLAFVANSFRLTGAASAGSSSAVALDGVDVAGSADHVATRAVVAVELSGKKVPASLVAGTDACGWWFDAVEGSTVSFGVATAKGRPKRALTGALLAPDRSLVATGTIKTKSGSLAASKIVCPQSGRYYFVASSTDAGAATQLLGTLAVAAPKSGKGAFASFAPKDTTTVDVGALPGAVLTLKFAGDKKKQLAAKVVSVTRPDGVGVPSASLVKANALGGTLTMTLAAGGTWRIVLGAASATGDAGKLTYSYALKQPKGAAYVAE